MLKLMNKKILTFYAENFCISKPVVMFLLVPSSAEETQRQTEFYKKRGIPMPNGDLQSKFIEQT